MSRQSRFDLYGNNTHYDRPVLFSRNVESVNFHFKTFRTEPNQDKVQFYGFSEAPSGGANPLWWTYSGYEPWGGKFYTQAIFTSEIEGQQVTRLRWISDETLNFQKGWEIDQVVINCAGNLQRSSSLEIDPNRAVDGFLLGPDDAIHFNVTQPAGTRLFLHLKSIAGTAAADFDIYASTTNIHPGPQDYQWKGVAPTTSPEFIQLPEASQIRKVYVTVTSYDGAGHFRAHANIVTKWGSQNVRVEPGYFDSASVNEHLRNFTKGTYQATDGHVFIDKYNVYYDGQSCEGGCDIWFGSTACEQYDSGRMPIAFCRSSTSGTEFHFCHYDKPDYKVPLKSAILGAHEFGHCIWDLPDEYQSIVVTNEPGDGSCGHSIMEQYQSYRWGANDFCTSLNHDQDPVPGKLATQWVLSAWESLDAQTNYFFYPPSKTPDPRLYLDPSMDGAITITLNP